MARGPEGQRVGHIEGLSQAAGEPRHKGEGGQARPGPQHHAAPSTPGSSKALPSGDSRILDNRPGGGDRRLRWEGGFPGCREAPSNNQRWMGEKPKAILSHTGGITRQ